MSKKLTPWFDGRTDTPAYVGVYPKRGGGFQHWNGAWWGLYCQTAKKAASPTNADFRSMYQTDDWRGLAVKPKGWK